MRVEASNLTLTVLGQQFQADLAVERGVAADGSAITIIGLNDVSLTLVVGAHGLSLANGSGLRGPRRRRV